MSKAKEFLRGKLIEELSCYYKDPNTFSHEKFDILLNRWADDSVFSEEHRFALLNLLIEDLKNKKILDMAAGCGSFTLQGLRNGYNVFGVEPEDWKQKLIDLKFEENNYDESWRNRIVQGVGEDLPFEDESFDVFDSWQTIEHVGNEKECIYELYRVLKKGGRGILRGPNYKSFYEGHYRIFWFPMLGDSAFARKYLKFRGRPLEGLQTFHPVNPSKVKRYAKNAGFKVINIKKYQIDEAIKRRIPLFSKSIFKPGLWLFYQLWDFYRGVKSFGRTEATISLLLIKE